MTKIHHKTQAKAADEGIVLELDNDNVVAKDAETERVLQVGDNAKAVLEAAIAAKAEIDENGDPSEDSSKSVISQSKKAEYRENGGNCGDDIAQFLSAAVTGADNKCDIEELKLVARDNGIEDRLQKYIDDGRNPGMCRMNVGNILRGMHRNGHDVTIDGKLIEGMEIDL